MTGGSGHVEAFQPHTGQGSSREISAAMIARSATVTGLPHWRQAFHPIRAMESAPARSAMNGGKYGPDGGIP